MEKKLSARARALKVYEILSNETDEDNPIGTTALLNKLKECGMPCERKALYKLIDSLNESGFEVLCKREISNMYYIVNRNFDMAELRILVDAVKFANFITPNKSKELIEKISALAGSNKSKVLRKSTNFDTIKQKNEHIYYNIATIDEGILARKQISFMYFDYDENGKPEYRKNGERYIVNPLSLMFNDNNYYLICYNDKYLNISSYRVDRMNKVLVENKKITKAECADKFNMAEYRKTAFSMMSGDIEKISLEFEKELIDLVRDKFGTDIKMTYAGENKYKVQVNAVISNTFFGWCTTMGTRLKIRYPQSVADRYMEYLKEIFYGEKYKYKMD